MSMDKSLKKRGSLLRARNVLKRDERIARLADADKWTDESSPYGLPKVRVYRVVAKKAKKAKKEDEATTDAAAAPAAGAASAAAKPAGKAPPAAKPGGKAGGK